MMVHMRMKAKSAQLGGTFTRTKMTKPNAWAKISAYMAENKINMALEANMLQENMAVEASGCENGKTLPSIQKLDCIYDEEPLGFEKYPLSSSQKMQAQDPLEEIDIGDGSIKRPTYISANIPKELHAKLVELLKEFKDCFAWDYNKMPGLSRNLVEHRLPIRPDKEPVKQSPRRFALEILSKIKEEIERLLRSKFIRTA
ncbi:hypothetical protein L195_g025386, partial [Trifolium pratense]